MAQAQPRTISATLATVVALIGLIVAIVLAGDNPSVISAQTSGSASDPRATVIAGNVAIGDCRTGGQLIPESALTFSLSPGGQFLTITAVHPGFTVTAVFVKGGEDTNLYEPGQRGLPSSPPWVNLTSPLTGGGQLPEISHWFACGTVTPTTTSTTTTPTTTTTSTTTTTTTVPAPPPPTISTTTSTTASPTSTTTSLPAQQAPTTTSTTTLPESTTTTVVAALPPPPPPGVTPPPPTIVSPSGGVSLPTTGGSLSLAPIALALAALGLLVVAATRRREPPKA